MDKFDYRIVESSEYSKAGTPSIVHLNERNYITYHDKGEFNINNEHFKLVVSAMYDLAEGIRQAASTSKKLDWFRNYEPYPLNSYWNQDGSFILMIKQPNFTIPELLPIAKASVESKYPREILDQIKFTREEEGYEVQLVNHGPLNSEAPVWDKLADFTAKNNLELIDPGHREVYLTNLLTTPPDAWDILVRQEISPAVEQGNLPIITN